jgi:hypothetical protein
MFSVPPATHKPVQQKDRLYDSFPVLIAENVDARCCCPIDQGRGDYAAGPPGSDVMHREYEGYLVANKNYRLLL